MAGQGGQEHPISSLVGGGGGAIVCGGGAYKEKKNIEFFIDTILNVLCIL